MPRPPSSRPPDDPPGLPEGDSEGSSTITRNIRVLREKLKETTGQLEVLSKAQLKRRLKPALERLYPSRWKRTPDKDT